ncbi:MAG: hypothetical protein V1787_05655 [Candidatus Micrarchaeota archaeon]
MNAPRGQASAELLLLLAAAAGFFLVLAPAFGEAVGAAEARLAAEQEQAAAERISALAEAAALLPGGVLETRVHIPVDTQVEADGERIVLRFGVGGREMEIWRKCALAAARTEMGRGGWSVRATAGGLEFSREGESN